MLICRNTRLKFSKARLLSVCNFLDRYNVIRSVSDYFIMSSRRFRGRGKFCQCRRHVELQPSERGAPTFFRGGGKIRRKGPENFFVPPLSEFYPPPESLRGGYFGCPPPELLRRGTILRGGTVPPLKLLRGGTVPYSPPCIRSCIRYKCMSNF